MVIVMKNNATEEQIKKVIERVESLGLKAHPIYGQEKTIIGVIGDENILRAHPVNPYEGVEEVKSIAKPFKFASREFKQEDTIIDVNGIKIGGGNFVVMAGPCSVENRDMLFETAKRVKEAGASILRGGAFKPRTSPYDFQGLGEEGLKYLKEAAIEYNMAVITEVMDARDIELIDKYADIFQVGARNMQNFTLLKELGKTDKPVMLKRGMAATVKDLLMAAEYIIASGNKNVILCERGIRTFETYTRNTVDINIIPSVKELSHLPIIIDSSHGTGRRSHVGPIALAGLVAGADGSMIEVHPSPENALSDGPQSLRFHEFDELMSKMKKYLEFEGRKLS
ncbi:3-deoxy-7-phosphoheptulonate synthase [Haliovirga abyssi]|uniref:3-deoxy-7-phosphoheptulonate synthase n=1 Tax=Haliovirga abyssi TaxID=2996794 RepID=A0AAU9DW15_9FUSO|nr:3-deoxy-7-phosphoheptulonate synthase [Haliovirga abyssi]BDU50431.1 3-deoxy-7-phosphoheptulonate synthase [Haliovirga abyssi]